MLEKIIKIERKYFKHPEIFNSLQVSKLCQNWSYLQFIKENSEFTNSSFDIRSMGVSVLYVASGCLQSHTFYCITHLGS